MDATEICRLIAARCGDVLSPDEIDRIETALACTPPPVMISDALSDRLAAVLEAFDRRLAVLEAAQ